MSEQPDTPAINPEDMGEVEVVIIYQLGFVLTPTVLYVRLLVDGETNARARGRRAA